MIGAVDDGLYRALMAVHVVMAVAWVGGGLMLTMQAERGRRAGDETEMAKVALSADFWAKRVFIPASLVLLACGLGMVADGHIGFSKPFVDIGLAGWAVSFVLGAAFLGPQGAQVGELVTAEGGVVTEACMAKLNRILLVARVDLVILLLVIVNMVVKPGGGV
ncbi:MAG TPA: DUF2269 family protein [Acidimicrobiales bacterium]|nr:DUF2269 family protein [Acidimicrobiales bacterium]